MTNPWQEYKKKLGNTRPWDVLNPHSEKASDQVANSRMSVCLECPELVNISKQCKQCGCVMPLKVKLLKAECPIGKW
jgi:hypothetical protein